MSDRIDLTGITVSASHGVLEWEQDSKQIFVIDLSIYTDHSSAVASDDIADTLDYGRLSFQVHQLVANSSFALIEKLADEIARSVLEDERVERVVVTVHKPEAPMPTRDMLSTPPPMARSFWPDMICAAARFTASRPEAQKRLICTPGTSLP